MRSTTRWLQLVSSLVSLQICLVLDHFAIYIYIYIYIYNKTYLPEFGSPDNYLMRKGIT
jgi:hypothetical protein